MSVDVPAMPVDVPAMPDDHPAMSVDVPAMPVDVPAMPVDHPADVSLDATDVPASAEDVPAAPDVPAMSEDRPRVETDVPNTSEDVPVLPRDVPTVSEDHPQPAADTPVVDDRAEVPDAMQDVGALDAIVDDVPDAAAADAPDATRAGCAADGDCADAGSTTHCDPARGACVACLRDAHCDAGRVCLGGACVPECDDARPCADGATCCAGSCARLASSVANCGACGRRCAAANGVAMCSAGACGVAACNEGYGDCDGSSANGCETNLRGDTSHCGRCGSVCGTASGQPLACVDGVCRSPCAPWYASCGTDPYECSTYLASDAANCGGCGLQCPSFDWTNSIRVCTGGSCQFVGCVAGWSDCNGASWDGCETNLDASPTDCGWCGHSCFQPNAGATCLRGNCDAAWCLAGFANCDGWWGNGCEANLATDPNHCGACGAHPQELCDGIDNDCDRAVDEGCPSYLLVLAGELASPPFGAMGGASFELACPPGQVAIGLHGRVGTSLQSLGLICQSVAMTRRGANDFAVQRTGDPSFTAAAGGASGTPFEVTCASGFITGLQLRGMFAVEQIYATCGDYSVRGDIPRGFHVVSSATPSTPTVGGGGFLDGTFTCPAPYALQRLAGGTSGAVDRLTVGCAQLSIN